MRIAVLTDLHWPAPTRRAINESLVQQARELGHRVDLVGVSTSPGRWLAGKALQEAVPRDCDAYLVHDDAAVALLPLLERYNHPYVIFDALDLVRHQPTIISNLDEAVERAVVLLAEEGWTSVGLLSYADNRNLDLEQFRYQRGLRHYGSRYASRMATTSLDPKAIALATRRLLKLQVDAVYVADDNLLPAFHEELARQGRVPGRDLGVIAMSSRDSALPGNLEWSRMVFDPDLFSQRTLQALFASLQRADSPPGNLSTLLLWEPGATHRRGAGTRDSMPRRREPGTPSKPARTPSRGSS